MMPFPLPRTTMPERRPLCILLHCSFMYAHMENKGKTGERERERNHSDKSTRVSSSLELYSFHRHGKEKETDNQSSYQEVTKTQTPLMDHICVQLNFPGDVSACWKIQGMTAISAPSLELLQQYWRGTCLTVPRRPEMRLSHSLHVYPWPAFWDSQVGSYAL